MQLLRRSGRVLAWLFVLACVGVLLAVVAVPRVMGWVPLTVLSQSMEPTYPAGSQVVVEPLAADDVADLRVDDVVTFLPRPDDPSLVTHRIVARSYRQDGTPVFRTRGDANNVDDQWALTAQQIRGRVVYHVPWVGWAASALPQARKDVASVVLAGGLFGYAGWQLLSVARRRSARHRAA